MEHQFLSKFNIIEYIYIWIQLSIVNGKPVSCNTYVQFCMSVIAFSLEHYELSGGPHRRRQIFEIGSYKGCVATEWHLFCSFLFQWFNTLDLTFIDNHKCHFDSSTILLAFHTNIMTAKILLCIKLVKINKPITNVYIMHIMWWSHHLFIKLTTFFLFRICTLKCRWSCNPLVFLIYHNWWSHFLDQRFVNDALHPENTSFINILIYYNKKEF